MMIYIYIYRERFKLGNRRHGRETDNQQALLTLFQFGSKYVQLPLLSTFYL